MVEPPVTLADVAKRAGVSSGLVSLALRGAPGASAATKERILAAAHELGYRPDRRARSLARVKSQMIGVLFGAAGQFHFELIDGLYDASEEFGWDLVLSALTTRRDEQRALDSLHDFRFDALVMLGPPVAQPLLAGRIPVVAMGWHVDHPDVDVVRTSDQHGMWLAVAHLAELGHERIAHLQGGNGLVAVSRAEGYLAAMRSFGLESSIRIVAAEGESQLEGQRAAQQLFPQGEPLPTGIIAFNDDLAAAAMTVLMQQGIDVPGDVSVVGFDDSALARSPVLNLTSVTQSPREMGRLAVQRIIERADGHPIANREIVLEPELRVRATTGPVPSTASPAKA